MNKQEEQGKTDVAIARIICETLSPISLASDVAVELFPLLCKLMNSKESSLRREAAELMSKVDVSTLMNRAKKAEEDVR